MSSASENSDAPPPRPSFVPYPGTLAGAAVFMQENVPMLSTFDLENNQVAPLNDAIAANAIADVASTPNYVLTSTPSDDVFSQPSHNTTTAESCATPPGPLSDPMTKQQPSAITDHRTEPTGTQTTVPIEPTWPSAASRTSNVTSTDEEVSEEDSNDSTFRSDVLDPLISCDPTGTTAASDGGRQRRPAITKQKMVSVLRSMDPNMVKTATQCLEAYIKARKWTNPTAYAREFYACSQVRLTAIVIHRKISKSRITFLQMREYIENVAYLFDSYADCEEITRLGGEIRQLILMVEYLASCLERCSGKGSTDWIEVARLFPIEVLRETTPASDLSPLFNRIRILEKLSGRDSSYHFGFATGNLYRVTLAESVQCAMKLLPFQDAADSSKDNQAKAPCASNNNEPLTTAGPDPGSTRVIGGTMDRVVCAVISSPFLFGYYASFTTCDANVLLFECVEGISLQYVLNFEKKIQEDLLKHVLSQLIIAVEHLHLKGFIHRDIKPSGLMLLHSGRIKLTDLTRSKLCIGRFAPSCLKSYTRCTPYEFNDRELIGTIPYMSPEVLRTRPYGRASDWWSVGMTAFALYFGQLPFRSPHCKAAADGTKTYAKYPAMKWSAFVASARFTSLVKGLLVRRPSRRLCSSSYLEVRSHSFFAEIDWNAVSSGAATFDCTHLIEHTRDAASALNSDAATLGVCVHAENEGKLPMFTYTSQGFGRVIQKLLKKRKIQPLDIVDPHEIIPPSVKYVYKFKDYRKTQARQKSSPRNPMTQTVSSISIEEARGSEHFSDRPSLTNAKTSILSFVKELRNGL